jgi:hypothetical protein
VAVREWRREGGENYISRTIVIFALNILFGQNNGDDMRKVCSTH